MTCLTRADDARSFTPCQRQRFARHRSASDDSRCAPDVRMRDIAYIALGSNIGDRAAHLEHGRAALAALPGSRLLAVTTVEETTPLGGPLQGPYLNQMAAVETTLEPRALLLILQQIERDAGRHRAERWGPRTLDLDIVRFGEQQVSEPDLTIPHPGLATRDFWQRELAELGATA
jgi:2-amino-4-hydroxy-6-hydroxymethyldihydropteridine diphosphokinase